MLNLLKSDLYRLARSRFFWALVAITIIVCFAVAAMIAWVASPEFSHVVSQAAYEQADGQMSPAERAEMEAEMQEEMDAAALPDGKVMLSLTHTWAQTFLSGGFLSLIGALVITQFLLADFEGGFVKNVPMGRAGRRAYYGEKLLFAALLQAIFLALCTLTTTIGFAVYGFTYQGDDTPTQIALWLALGWLFSCVYAFIGCCVAWLTRSNWGTTTVVVLICSGLVGSIVLMLCDSFAPAMPWLGQVHAWLPSGMGELLGSGAATLLVSDPTLMPAWMLPAWHILLVEGLFISACIAVVFAVCRRKDIS